MKRYLALFLLLVPAGIFSAIAQKLPPLYYIRNDARVLENGNYLVTPWSGGMNNPQPSMADLNHDGKEDLVLYEDFIGVKTFINTGTTGNPKYVYDGNYEANFPRNMRSYMKLLDFNRDGVKDLIHRGSPGFYIMWGYYDANNHLAFNDFAATKPPQQRGVYFMQYGGWVNAYCEVGDIPEIIDIDGDGDYDLLGYSNGGARVGFYKNCQIEDGYPNDSLHFCFSDKCWGKFFQPNERTMILGFPCDTIGTTCKGCGNGSGNKTTHTGNTLCLLDYDGDGDLDALNGNISFPDIQLLINGKKEYNYPVDTMISQDTMWNSHGTQLHTDNWPGAFHLDIDQDGKRDLLFSPHGKFLENYKSLTFYKNIGTEAHPNFQYQTSTYLVDQMIDVGIYSQPVFYDYNKDGKKDMFIGTGGIYQASTGTLKVMISYYQNISDPGYPSFKLITKDFMGLSDSSLKGAMLSFGDLDNDTLDDMIIGQTDGTILFFKNMAASSAAQPIWRQVADTPNLVYMSKNGNVTKIDVGSYAAPFIYDLDKDGKEDLVIGAEMGYLYYYKNTGTVAGVMSLDSLTDTLGKVRLRQSGYATTHTVPYIGHIDDAQNEYLVLGSYLGTIYVYNCYDNGNVLDSFTLADDNYQYIYPGLHSTPAIADIDGDGLMEMFVGNELGGINLYRQLYKAGIGEKPARERNNVKVYPNPAKDILNLVWDNSFAGSDIEISLVNATGQKVKSKIVAAGEKGTRLNIGDLPAGLYYSIVQSSTDRAVNPVTIIR